MLSGNQLLVGGVAAGVIAVIGSLANLTTLHLLLNTTSARTNPTTVLIIFLTASNLVYTGLVLPQTAASMLSTKVYEENPIYCQLYSFLFFWTFLSLIFIQVALAVNRWTLVCTDKFSYTVTSSILSGLVCWLAAMLVCLIPTTIDRSQQFGWDPEYGTCSVKSGRKRTTIFILCIALPYLIIALCYIQIMKKIKESKIKLKEALSRQTSAKSELELSVTAANEKIKHSALKLKGMMSRQASVQSEGEISEGGKDSQVIRASSGGGSTKTPTMRRLQMMMRTRERLRQRKEWKVTMMIGIILIVFLVCTIPTAIVMEIDPRAEHYPNGHILCYILSWLIGVTNPLVYVLSTNTYTRAAITGVTSIGVRAKSVCCKFGMNSYSYS